MKPFFDNQFKFTLFNIVILLIQLIRQMEYYQKIVCIIYLMMNILYLIVRVGMKYKEISNPSETVSYYNALITSTIQSLIAFIIFKENPSQQLLYIMSDKFILCYEDYSRLQQNIYVITSIVSTLLISIFSNIDTQQTYNIILMVLFYYTNFFNIISKTKAYRLSIVKTENFNFHLFHEVQNKIEKCPLAMKDISSRKLQSGGGLSHQSSIQSQRGIDSQKLLPRKKSDSLNYSLVKEKFNKSMSKPERDYLSATIWHERMNLFPIGIGILQKANKKFKFMNDYLKDLLQKISSQHEELKLSVFLLYDLEFKLVHKPKKLQRFNSLRFSETDSSRLINSKYQSPKEQIVIEKTWKLNNLIDFYVVGNLEQYVNPINKSIEAQCTYTIKSQENKRNFITMALTILYCDSYNDVLTIVVNDITKHNELLDIEIKEKFKSKVINSFSHELRTPLNGAQLYLYTCMNDLTVNESVKSIYVNPALNALKLQGFLINDIVDFSALNEGIFDLKIQQVYIDELIEEITSLFEPIFKQKNIGFTVQVDDRVPDAIKVDFQRLCQILTNIISNALKFSSKGNVSILITRFDEHRIQFSVKDEGVGIEKQKLRRLKHTLGAQNLADRIGNIENWSGQKKIKLNYYKMILYQITPEDESKLDIYSAGVNKGCKVSFQILNYPQSSESMRWLRPKQFFRDKKREFTAPIQHSLFKLHKISHNLNKKSFANSFSNLNENQSDLINQEDDDQQQIQKLMKPSLILENTIQKLNCHSSSLIITGDRSCICKRILSVDDEVFNQTSLGMLLKQVSFEVITVYNGQEAINFLKKNCIKKCSNNCQLLKAVLMDCQMPVLDGWETTKMLRTMMENKLIPHFPIIGLTAFTTKTDIEKCYNSGMDFILHKPLKLKELKQLISFG